MDKEDKKEIVGMFEYISGKMATKEDLERFATKEDLERFATKEDLERFATKEDLERFATKEDLERFATKEDMESGFQEVRSDIKGLRTDLNLVEEKTESNTGFAKEIDILFSEVKNIKEHIGLKEAC